MFDKKSLAVLTTLSMILCFSALAKAGLPEDDPVIAELRTEFQNAKAPTRVQLNLGKSWRCVSKRAQQGRYQAEGPEDVYLFTEFNGLILSNDLYQYAISNAGMSTAFIAETDGETGTAFVTIRATASGDIIAESSWPSSFLREHQLPHGPTSLISPDREATRYTVCPMTEEYL